MIMKDLVPLQVPDPSGSSKSGTKTARVPGWTMIVSSFGHIAPQTVHDHETGVLATTHMEKNWEPPP
jgi:hypothetical protein